MNLNYKVIYQPEGNDPMLCIIAGYDNEKETYDLQRLSDEFQLYGCDPKDIKRDIYGRIEDGKLVYGDLKYDIVREDDNKFYINTDALFGLKGNEFYKHMIIANVL